MDAVRDEARCLAIGLEIDPRDRARLTGPTPMITGSLRGPAVSGRFRSKPMIMD